MTLTATPETDLRECPECHATTTKVEWINGTCCRRIDEAFAWAESLWADLDPYQGQRGNPLTGCMLKGHQMRPRISVDYWNPRNGPVDLGDECDRCGCRCADPTCQGDDVGGCRSDY